MMKLAITMLLLCAVAAEAKVKEVKVEYSEGDQTLEGYVVRPSAGKKSVPGVVMVHEWMGIGETTMNHARRLAELGYVVMVADIYGKGIRPKNTEEASAMAGKFKGDRPLLRRRVQAALDELRKQKGVNGKKIGAVGYCFGGTTVLELARSGADVRGVVSVHGGLGTPTPADGKTLKAKILALHGGDDPYVPEDEVKAFQQEMRTAKADWQFFSYGGAVHSFTNPLAGNDPSKGAAYNESASQRSWEAMKQFFSENL